MLKSWTGRIVAIGIALVICFLISDDRIRYWKLHAESRKLAAESFPSGDDDHGELRMVMNRPGLRNPDLHPVKLTSVSNDEKVIGVVVDDQPIAYVVEELASPHIVNSMVQGKPISVTYCELVRCARVLTADSSEPIPLNLGGQDGNMQMVFEFKGARYAQESKKLPLEDHLFEVCTFGEWRGKHPGTLVFTGEEHTSMKL
jgi:hypothetical protein